VKIEVCKKREKLINTPIGMIYVDHRLCGEELVFRCHKLKSWRTKVLVLRLTNFGGTSYQNACLESWWPW